MVPVHFGMQRSHGVGVHRHGCTHADIPEVEISVLCVCEVWPGGCGVADY